MTRLIAFLACLVIALPAAGQSMVEGNFDPAVPTLEQVVGHRSGARITAPDETLRYFEALAEAAPDRFRLVRYATSWEGRPLVYAVVTSAANMARIEAVQADLQALGQGTAPSALSNVLPVTWLGYGVHGDEISSTDAGLALAYHLLASRGDASVDAIMRDSVVIIDPSQNPDGRARFVSKYREQLGIQPFGDRHTAGHDQPWPSGRFNHYLFDLNRDWFALTQPETRGKVAAVQRWQPVVLVDAHEMGGDSTYFFPPSADPFNPNITAGQRDKQVLLGRAIGAAMDRIGEPYYTREIFDAFYPGYGDTWPTLNGAIAMTFEQASSGGLVWTRSDGTTLTYADGVRNHFVATLATADAVARNATLFLSDYADYRRGAVSGAAGEGGYIIDLAARRWNAEALGRRLVEQGIAVGRVAGPTTACGRRYPEGYLSVSLRQPAARLIRSLMDRNTELPADFTALQEQRRANDLPHEIYDTTAWSVPLMSGLDVARCAGASGVPVTVDEPMPDRAQAAGGFGLVVPWSDSGQVRLVTEALKLGMTGRATDREFTADGRTFPRGSVIFARAANRDTIDRLVEIAREVGAETLPLQTGWVEQGPNFGSDRFVSLSLPRVAMVWDDGVSPTSAGSIRYVLEQRFGMPVAPVRSRTIARADLGEYDVLIVPDGKPGDALGAGGRAAVARFARAGGVVVAMGDAILALTEGDDALFSAPVETVLGGEPAGEDNKDEEEAARIVAGEAIASETAYRERIQDAARRPDTLPGALLNTVIDADNYLSAGYDAAPPVVFAAGDVIFSPLGRDQGTNVVRYAGPDTLVASGHVWGENRRQLAFKPYMMAERAGEGIAIGFAQDPTMRGYLDGLDLLVANAVLMAPARVR